jgi:hypothetical protein
MFIGPGDLITIDGNYYHDVSGRAPKLGADGVMLGKTDIPVGYGGLLRLK